MNASKRFLIFIWLLFLAIHFESPVKADTIGGKAKKILNELLNASKYDPTVVPVSFNETTNQETPVIVNVNLLVRAIDDFDDVKMQYSPQITFRQNWNDPRLKFDNKNGQIPYIVLSKLERIWTPDTFFKNEKQGHFHQMLKPNQLIRIYPNGDVLYSIRISLTLACPMDHKFYPHSKQICSIHLSSYGFSTKDVMYLWKENDPVQVNRNLHLEGYFLTKYLTDYCTSRTNTGEYSCLKADFLFASETGKFFWQLYLPSTALIIASWLSFWLHPKATIARATLIGISTLLLHFVLTSFKLPQVDYTMLINLWNGACYIFMFGALIEFVLVSSGQIANENGYSNVDQKDIESSNGWRKRILSRIAGRSNKLDLISRAIFPIAFVLFCIFYCCKVNRDY